MTHVFLVRVLAMCIIRVPYPEGPGASLTVLFFTFFFIEKLTSEILSGASLPKSTMGTFYFVSTVDYEKRLDQKRPCFYMAGYMKIPSTIFKAKPNTSLNSNLHQLHIKF